MSLVRGFRICFQAEEWTRSLVRRLLAKVELWFKKDWIQLPFSEMQRVKFIDILVIEVFKRTFDILVGCHLLRSCLFSLCSCFSLNLVIRVTAKHEPQGHANIFCITIFMSRCWFILCAAVCPHLGCAVKWNPKDSTFDCPCHGSQLNTNGVCIQGPAGKGLGKLFTNQN